MDKRTEEFLNDPIFPLLVKMSAPNTVAFFIQSIVVLAEVWLISKLGTISLAAVTLAYPAVMLTQQMAWGSLGGAVTSSISRSMGAGDKPRAERLLWHSIFLACGGAFIFIMIFFIFGEQLLMLLGGKGVLLEKSLTYSMIFLSGGIVVWLSGTLTAALRGIGDMRFPAMLTLASAALQTILSAGLILGLFGFPRLELVGAALSIVITGLFTALVLIIKLSCFTNSIQLKFSRITLEKELFKDIFSVALPASLSPIFTVGTILILTGLIGQFGSSALAGYGIGSRVEFLMIPIVFGIGTAMTAMVGTNIGAKNITRAEKIGFTGAISAGLLSAVIGVTLALTPNLWINFFTSDQSTFLVTKQYIEILGFFYIFQGFGLSLFFASQGADAMKWPIIATILRCVITAIGALLAVYYFSSGLAGIFYSSAIAMAFFGIMMMVSLKMGAWRKK